MAVYAKLGVSTTLMDRIGWKSNRRPNIHAHVKLYDLSVEQYVICALHMLFFLCTVACVMRYASQNHMSI